ncbi:MAG: hypothetical protein HYY17_16650 [Planctomycetes bacterium]|nr:hypothetical protein [Planctomycetota bacterium]
MKTPLLASVSLTCLLASSFAQDAVEVKTSDGAGTSVRTSWTSTAAGVTGDVYVQKARLRFDKAGAPGYFNLSGAATASPLAGDVYYDGSNLLFRDSTGWRTVTTSGGGSTTTAVLLQSSTPGTPQTGHFNLSGTGILGTSLNVTAASNQLVLLNTTLNASSGTARTYTIPDVGANADFVMTAGPQTIAGAKSFTSTLTVSSGASASLSLTSTAATGNANALSATSLTTGNAFSITGPTGGTTFTGYGLTVTADPGDNSRIAYISGTARTATAGQWSYGLRSTLQNSSAVANIVAASFANAWDNATATGNTMYAVYGMSEDPSVVTAAVTKTHTGGFFRAYKSGASTAGTFNLYGIRAEAEGDLQAATTTTAYGIYAEAKNADTNWAGWFQGDVYISGATTHVGTTSYQNNVTFDANVTIGNAATDSLTVTSEILGASPLSFEGLTNNDIRTTFAITDPTAAQTITFPNATGTVTLGTGTTNYAAYWSGTNTVAAEQYLALSRGGTAAGLTASNGGIVYSTATALAVFAGTATAGQMLRSGASTTPSWSTATWPATAAGTGTILRADGTNWVATTATYPATTTINRILYSSGANVIGEITTANSGVLVTGATGIPSIATDIPTAVTIGTAYIYRAGGTDVAVADGGTGLSSYTVGDLLYASAATTLSRLADVAAGSALLSGGVGVAPSWGNAISGSLATQWSVTTSNTANNTSAVYGNTTGASGTIYGVWGATASPDGAGVYGSTSVAGTAGTNWPTGLQGSATASTGTTTGILGTSQSSRGIGIQGVASPSGIGYYWSVAGIRTAIWGAADANTGETAYGVYGNAQAVTAQTPTICYGVYGAASGATTNWAGYFNGNVNVTGTMAAGGLITGSAGLTITGAAVNLNASSNFAVNIATGTSTGAVTIGGNSNTVYINSSDWNITTTGTMSGIGAITADNKLLIAASTTMGQHIQIAPTVAPAAGNDMIAIDVPSTTNAFQFFECYNGGSTRFIIDGNGKITVNLAADGTLAAFQSAGTQEGYIGIVGTTVSYNGFTGSHFGRAPLDREIPRWAVVVATGENRGTNGRALGKAETLYGVDTTDTPKDPRAFGVCGGWTETADGRLMLITAVGDGFILVTDTGGDIEVGDFLTTSSRRGFAQRQDDPALMNYTVAKAMHAVRWSAVEPDPKLGFKWRLIPCTFKAG